MAIQFSCECGTTLQAPEHLEGKDVRCPQCNAPNAVPFTRQQPPPLPPPLPGHDVFQPSEDPQAADFFVPQPPEIGRLRTAHTSLLVTTQPKGVGYRMLMGLIMAIGLTALVAVLLKFGWEKPKDDIIYWSLLTLLISTPIAIGLGFYFTHFSHYCAYVGEEGIALFTCSGSRERVKIKDVFLFSNAEKIRVSGTRHYHNGFYTHTDFEYRWSDDQGQEVYAIRGKHTSEKNEPPLHDQYYFGLAAETAWSDYLLQQILPQIRAGQAYTFKLGKGKRIVFNKDFLELQVDGRAQRFYPQDLNEVRVKEGKVSLKEPGAREGWFTSSGVHTFSFADLANAQVFLLLVENVFGVPLSA
jgi:hypothetical protein